MAGVFFPANGKFYAMGGRMSDTAGSEFTHPFEYDPVTNSWTTKSATYPDTHVNNMACGVLTDAGTPYIYCVGGSQVTIPDISDRVFRYDPVTDVISPVAAPWPGGRERFCPVASRSSTTSSISWADSTPSRTGARDQPDLGVYSLRLPGCRRATVLPVPLGYIPTTTIGSLIYTGGGSDITAGALTDTTNSFVYDPVADTIATIAAYREPQARRGRLTSATRCLSWAAAETAPNPSNEVDIYDPVSNSWSVGHRSPTPGATSRPTPTAPTTSGWQAATHLTVPPFWTRWKSSAAQ